MDEAVEDLDTLTQMIKVAFTLNGWEKMIELAEQLYRVAKRIYDEQQGMKAKGVEIPPLKYKRPLVYYFGYSHLIKGEALQKLNRFEEALDYIEKYSDLGWFNGLDEEGLAEVEYYRNIAKGNKITIGVHRGDVSAFVGLIEFLHDNPEELLPGILILLEGANFHNLNIDHYLEEFKVQISQFGGYEEPENNAYYVSFLDEYTEYNINKGRGNIAIRKLLDGLSSFDRVGDKTAFHNCISIFNRYKEYLSKEQQQEYIQIVESFQ
ncbi:DNA-binding protein [Paenibacillus sp. M1]|uniref:DNA-binding protein n=1 Tax=Paenibacillus haidiansis TaxID=1574488 RepID=A0ABU7VXS1_9BACL